MESFHYLCHSSLDIPSGKGLTFFGTFGALAHLARARHWQCRGDRFKSDMLHYGRMVLVCGIILFFCCGRGLRADAVVRCSTAIRVALCRDARKCLVGGRPLSSVASKVPAS